MGGILPLVALALVVALLVPMPVVSAAGVQSPDGAFGVSAPTAPDPDVVRFRLTDGGWRFIILNAGEGVNYRIAVARGSDPVTVEVLESGTVVGSTVIEPGGSQDAGAEPGQSIRVSDAQPANRQGCGGTYRQL